MKLPDRLPDTKGGEDATKELKSKEKIKQTIMVMQPSEKFEKCRELLKTGEIDVETKGHKVIVFMMTKKTCDMVANALWKEGLACDALHGDKEQWQRTRIMNAFKNGQTRVLFATDVAARGLDVKAIMTSFYWSMCGKDRAGSNLRDS